MPNFFTNYNRPPNVRTVNKSPSMALQQFKDESDINNLVARYHQTGTFYNALDCAGRVSRMPEFGDFSDLGDFREQQDKILQVYECFQNLPAKVRERFNNNPAFFVEYVGNEKNFKECCDMGIFEMPVESSTVPPPVESPTVGDGVAVEKPVETQG